MNYKTLLKSIIMCSIVVSFTACGSKAYRDNIEIEKQFARDIREATTCSDLDAAVSHWCEASDNLDKTEPVSDWNELEKLDKYHDKINKKFDAKKKELSCSSAWGE